MARFHQAAICAGARRIGLLDHLGGGPGAHLLNKPAIGLSHHPKVTTLMADLGLSDYWLDIETFGPQELMGAFTRLAAEASDIKARMAEKIAWYRQDLTAQSDRLFAAEVAR